MPYLFPSSSFNPFVDVQTRPGYRDRRLPRFHRARVRGCLCHPERGPSLSVPRLSLSLAL